MLDENKLQVIISELCEGLSDIFPDEKMDVIIFGSYARGDNTDESDIDVLLLVDASREVISMRSWQVGNVAADLLLSYGILVSPIIENREYFNTNAKALPFYRNICSEGVRFSA